MKINGKLNRIINEKQFIASFLATNGKPTAGFKDFGTARIHLATDFPSNKFPDESSFIPTVSLKTDADSTGRFSFDINQTMKNFRGYLIAYEKVGTVQPQPNFPPVPVFQSVYRSETFKLSAVKESLKTIFLLKTTTDDKDGFSQNQADEKAVEVRQENNFDKVSFLIREGRLSCFISARGAEIKFNGRLRASTSHKLDEFVEADAEDIDIDLPGPDFIVGLCVSKNDIKKQLRRIIKENSDIFNDIIAEKIPAALKGIASFTVHQIRYPVTGQKTINFPVPNMPDQTFQTRSVVPELTAGVPKKLF